MLAAKLGIAMENRIPVKIPVIKDAAPNMPAVAACCESTILNTQSAYYYISFLHSFIFYRCVLFISIMKL